MTQAWYVLQCITNKEEVVYKQLCANQIEISYPTMQKQQVNPCIRRFKPYFLGNILICTNYIQHQPSELKWLAGVVDLPAEYIRA